MKIITVVGARPQFIKAAAISIAISRQSEIEEIIVHTGQHYDTNMSDIFFEEMKIPTPRYNLSVGSGSHAKQTATMMVGLEDIFLRESPDAVLVYGDTNSTLAAALAASKLHIKIIHVEAGLRSWNRKMPEEINRVLVDHVSMLHFCPSEVAAFNLKREGVADSSIKIVGDVMVDAVMAFSHHVNHNILDSLKLSPGQFSLCTIHRAENTDDPSRLKNIVEFLRSISEEHPIVLPVHPRTRAKLTDLLSKMDNNIILIDPVGYLDMLALQNSCKSILTDSGGIQKEAYIMGKPCITLRTETEWVELVEAGCNLLLDPGTDPDQMAHAYFTFIAQWSTPASNIYGDGTAAQSIVSEIQATLLTGNHD